MCMHAVHGAVRRGQRRYGATLQKARPSQCGPHTPCVEPDELPRVRRVGAWGQHRGHQQPVVAKVDAHAGRGRRVAVAEFSVCVRGRAPL